MNPSDLRSRLDAIKKKGRIPGQDNDGSNADDISDDRNPAEGGNEFAERHNSANGNDSVNKNKSAVKPGLREKLKGVKVSSGEPGISSNSAVKSQQSEKSAFGKSSLSGNKASLSELPAAEKALQENGWKRISDMVYEKITLSENPLPEKISDFLMPQKADSYSLVFYDTETTGLSGGAGNLVFLAGFGFPENRKFKTVQLMLSDFPGEPAFLDAVKKYISTDRIYVSYNGKSFDSNLLKSRFAMNGTLIEFGYQLDLLYPSRRLWKNIIGSCSLGDIEREILEKRRTLDVPGAMVPDLYFDFIKTGKYSFIEGVAAHHLEDIISLAQLLDVFEKIFNSSSSSPNTDSTGLASLLLERHKDAAVDVLKAGFESGSYHAAKELGLLYRKDGRFKEAFNVWMRMWNDKKSIFAGIELAKHYEHREKNILKALKIIEEILSFERILIRSILPELEKRRKRLEAKMGKNKPLINI